MCTPGHVVAQLPSGAPRLVAASGGDSVAALVNTLHCVLALGDPGEGEWECAFGDAVLAACDDASLASVGIVGAEECIDVRLTPAGGARALLRQRGIRNESDAWTAFEARLTAADADAGGELACSLAASGWLSGRRRRNGTAWHAVARAPDGVLGGPVAVDVVAALRSAETRGCDINSLDDLEASPCRVAAENGHSEALQAFVAAGADVNAATPLYFAVRRGHTAAVRLLLAAGADVNLGPGPWGMCGAASDPRVPMEILHAVIAGGVDLDAALPTGETACHVAAYAPHGAERLAVLAAAGANVDVPMKNGATPCFQAAREGRGETLRALVEAGADIDAARVDGMTPAFVAAARGHIAALDVLIAAGADLNAATHCCGETPCCVAASTGRGGAEVIRLLSRGGASVDVPMKNGATPCFQAAREGHIETLRALIEAGADVDAARVDGMTPAFVAAARGHIAALDVLIAAGADLNAATGSGDTACGVAAATGAESVLRALIAAGADVDVPMKNGATPCFQAARGGHVGALCALLEAGADMDAARVDGPTPCFAAAALGHTAVVRRLISAGADVHTTNCVGMTPYWIAVHHAHEATACALASAGGCGDGPFQEVMPAAGAHDGGDNGAPPAEADRVISAFRMTPGRPQTAGEGLLLGPVGRWTRCGLCGHGGMLRSPEPLSVSRFPGPEEIPWRILEVSVYDCARPDPAAPDSFV